MKKSRFTDSHTLDAIKRAEAWLAVPDLCWELGISTTSNPCSNGQVAV